MAKTKIKTAFFCQNCGAQFPKWIGKCNSCNEWNTIIEEVISNPHPNEVHTSFTTKRTNKPQQIDDIDLVDFPRIKLPGTELNRVLGGGLVPGSLVLFGGDPGIGKSTLMLQMSLRLKGYKILYVTGEESEQQTKMRADRIGNKNPDCYILTETSTQNIFHHIKDLQPQLLVIDSIQTLHTGVIDSSPGSISQVRECTSELMRYAKETNTPVFLIGHITKDGNIAGPKILEHMVDVVLQFEGDRNHIYRLLRSIKNRFGSTNELGIYEMYGAGLREVENPSDILISNKDEQLSGAAIAATMEGNRPLLIEIQALVSSAAYGTPQRSTTGFDSRRLNMLLAVLEKRCGFRLGAKDVFLNIAGGLRIDDPSIDLAVISAILSSSEDMPIHSGICFAAEVGLSGEIRPISRIEQRIMEAEKLGFEKIVISKYNKKGLSTTSFKIELVLVSKVEEVFTLLFG
ncbi:MAG: DNA repair protein RadA [Flavobacteriales bacterium CG_4_10_14_0_2_um_filter_32_8]|nr:MAG: DNA repair protein RadA [Flavobacteriales bacterium CG_4_10_14_0_2_um_filter_32_8]PJB14219.1 MAG: DNA repair protein RadA [Flavobacteriales bacterium CG_4_9_14_3_um_filter_32_8]